MKSNTKNILFGLGFLVTSFIISKDLNNYIKKENLNYLTKKYSEKIYDNTKSEIATNYYYKKMKKMKSENSIRKYYKSLDKNKLRKNSKYYKEFSGYTLPGNMKTVSQKKLDSLFTFEDEWNNFQKTAMRYTYSKSLLSNLLKNWLTKSNKNYIKEMKNVKNPEEVTTMMYFMTYAEDKKTFGIKDFSASFKTVHKNKKDDCDGGFIYAAGLLSDNNFLPYELILSENDSNEDHALFIYKTDEGNFGTNGINICDNLYPRYNSIEKLVKKINKLSNSNFKSYEIYNIKKAFPNYINNKIDNNPRSIFEKLIRLKKD